MVYLLLSLCLQLVSIQLLLDFSNLLLIADTNTSTVSRMHYQGENVVVRSQSGEKYSSRVSALCIPTLPIIV